MLSKQNPGVAYNARNYGCRSRQITNKGNSSDSGVASSDGQMSSVTPNATSSGFMASLVKGTCAENLAMHGAPEGSAIPFKGKPPPDSSSHLDGSNNVRERPFQIGDKTRRNKNAELTSPGFASSRPAFQSNPTASGVNSWKPAILPKLNDVFLGNVKWISESGELFLHDFKVNAKLEEIRKSLNNAYNGTKPTEADLRCSKGDLCIAR